MKHYMCAIAVDTISSMFTPHNRYGEAVTSYVPPIYTQRHRAICTCGWVANTDAAAEAIAQVSEHVVALEGEQQREEQRRRQEQDRAEHP